MADKKQWVEPEIEEVALEFEEEVLATCYTNSRTTRRTPTPTCRTGRCVTYP